jgi:ornithine cyclodeaminase/alanine dehydrogenase-like protein (mu-crystallin family)
VELKDVVERPPAPQALTIFKSGGLGVEDVAVASYVYEQSETSGKQCEAGS